MSRAINILVMLLLVGCVTITNIIASPTPVTAINLEDAIKLGLKAAYFGGFDIRTIMVDPQSGHAYLTTLVLALKHFTGSESVPRGDQPDALVWIVTFEGQWQDGFPRTTEMPTPETYGYFSVIIDATTGGDYLVSTSP